MMREKDPVVTQIAAVIAQRLEETAQAMRMSREVMNAKEAAEFLRMPESEFRRIAPALPRHAVTERRYVYYRGELLEWALSR